MSAKKTLQTHQERVVTEKTELETKLESLNTFVKGEKFKELDNVEQVLLQRQAHVMQVYAGILDERIAKF